MKTASVTLTPDEIALLMDGLDAYRYWQLTGENDLEHLRNNGDVRVNGVEDEQVRVELAEIAALESRLEAMRLELSNPDQIEPGS